MGFKTYLFVCLFVTCNVHEILKSDTCDESAHVFPVVVTFLPVCKIYVVFCNVNCIIILKILMVIV